MAMTNINKILSFDPGFSGTGWAAWSVADWKKTVPPLKNGVIHPPHRGCLEDRGESLFKMVDELLTEFVPTRTIIEWPQFFAFSGKGQTTASSGSLGDLYLAASIIACCSWKHRSPTTFLTPTEWKGQLTKDQIDFRVRSTIGGHDYKNHALDAIGLGLFVKGVLFGVNNASSKEKTKSGSRKR